MWYVTYDIEPVTQTRRGCWDPPAVGWLWFVGVGLGLGLCAWAMSSVVLWSEGATGVCIAWTVKKRRETMDAEREAAIRASGVRDEDDALAVTVDGHVLACRAPHSTRTEIIDSQGRIFTYAYHVDVDGGTVPVYLEEE